MAISRYDTFRTVRDKDSGHLRLESFPAISAAEIADPVNDIIIEFTEGNRLDKLAFDYMGDGRYWWTICLLNDIHLPFATQITPGTPLRISTNVDRILNIIRNKLGDKE